MAFVATDTVLLGIDGRTEPGETVPDSYLDTNGDRQKTDFDRLLELGVVERKRERSKKSASKKS